MNRSNRYPYTISFLFDTSENKGEGFITPEKGKEPQDASSELFMKTPKGNRGLQYGKTQCRCGAPNCRQYFF